MTVTAKPLTTCEAGCESELATDIADNCLIISDFFPTRPKLPPKAEGGESMANRRSVLPDEGFGKA